MMENIIMSHPQLINLTIHEIKIKNTNNVSEIPAFSTQILGRNENYHPFDESFHWVVWTRDVVGRTWVNYCRL